MVSKRIGTWSWALSAEERLTATVVDRSQREKERVAMPMRRRYAAMLEKQKKLEKREAASGTSPNARRGGMRFAAQRD